MANIREVAQLAGVSIATVSRVLAGDSDFHTTEETKKAVYDAVNKLQYSPRPADKKYRLACILPSTAEKYSDPFFMSILNAMEKEADHFGATFSLIKNIDDITNPSVLQELLNTKLDGIIMMEILPKETISLIRKKIPNILFIDIEEADLDINNIGYDRYFANLQVMNHLIKLDYKRIAIISGPSFTDKSLDSTIRLTCYREALKKANIPYDNDLVKDCDWDLDICEKQVKELMELKNKPDVIFAGDDSLASCVLSTLYTLGYKVPEDVGVIGFNDDALSAHTFPPLTTIDIPTVDIGIAAIHRMIEMIKGRAIKTHKILFTTKLIERKSLRRK